MKSDHSNDTWKNNRQQNGTADSLSCGASKLGNRAPVQAVKMEASLAPTTISILMNATLASFATQIGNGHMANCQHSSTNQDCIFCDREILLHVFSLYQKLQTDSIPETNDNIDLCPCSLAIINAIQHKYSSVPF
jgi:hypothetical protein